VVFFRNLRSKTLGQIKNLDPHRLMSGLKSKTTPGEWMRPWRGDAKPLSPAAASVEHLRYLVGLLAKAPSSPMADSLNAATKYIAHTR
jgi:hypothetical protein